MPRDEEPGGEVPGDEVPGGEIPRLTVPAGREGRGRLCCIYHWSKDTILMSMSLQFVLVGNLSEGRQPEKELFLLIFWFVVLKDRLLHVLISHILDN